MSSKSGGAKKARAEPGRQIITDNRKARFNYEIMDRFEAGLELTGSEVKALRAGKASIAQAYASDKGNELFLMNSFIPEYKQAGHDNHMPRRPRKLLLHRREISRLLGAIQRAGLTIVPLKLYFNDRGIAKIELALARGKKLHDKRRTERDRDWARQKARVMRDKG